MTGLSLILRTLTPAGRAGVAGLLILLAGLLAWRTGVRWDPLGLGARRLERAETRAEAAEADALARGLEGQGERHQQLRLDIHHRTVRAAEVATVAVVQQSGFADDASVPLDPARAARLRAHDGELCRIAVDLGGCATASDAG